MFLGSVLVSVLSHGFISGCLQGVEDSKDRLQESYFKEMFPGPTSLNCCTQTTVIVVNSTFMAKRILHVIEGSEYYDLKLSKGRSKHISSN